MIERESDKPDSIGENENSTLTLQKNWVGSLCAYYRDFLDTDFRSGYAPKRSITSRDLNNNLTGVALSKYPKLNQKLWTHLAKPFKQQLYFSFTVRRNQYRSRLSKNLNDVIQRYARNFTDEKAKKIISYLKNQARKEKEKFKDDPERFADEFALQVQSALLESIVDPFLGALKKSLTSETLNSPEVIFGLKEELGEQLIDEFSANISPAIATALVDDDFNNLDTLLEDACSPNSVQAKFLQYFEIFATNDFFYELSEFKSTLRLRDNFQIYIYVCTLRTTSSSYPLFYFPVDITFKDSKFTIKSNSHLLLNKKAIDFAVTEIARANNQGISFTIPERIIYLSKDDSFLKKIQSELDKFIIAVSFNGVIDLNSKQPQKVARGKFQVDNSLYFAAFDAADESLLNDYEDLLSTLDTNSLEAKDFIEIIDGFINDNPIPIDYKVDEKWQQMPITDRLVYDSPVPLNEEQRKILIAINNKDCRFIAVEGPPGTGKSHTITACVFDMILKGKNTLILSDKKEALDVAEEKIRQTLRKVRIDTTFQDPILRLGKQGSSYTKIMSPATINQLTTSTQIATGNAEKLENSINNAETRLKTQIDKQLKVETTIDLRKIITLQESEVKFCDYHDDLEKLFRNYQFQQGIQAANALVKFFSSEITVRLLRETGTSFSINDLNSALFNLARVASVLQSVTLGSFVTQFGCMSSQQLPTYTQLIDRIEDARVPIFGYFFSGSKLKDINRELRNTFDLDISGNLPDMLPRLKSALNGFKKINRALDSKNITDDKLINIAFLIAINGYEVAPERFKKMRDRLVVLSKAINNDDGKIFEAIGVVGHDLSDLSENGSKLIKNRIKKFATHVKRLNKMTDIFEEVPEIDYAAELENIACLHTQQLANNLDKRVVDFARTKRNKAQQIKDIIKKKQKFPKDLFQELRQAFPVIIAGIRDYAEYVPLEKGLFDLIIIDEASQVSIAQAMPAFIRSKKVVVFGDKCQFSNVKTAHASKSINKSYMHKVLEQYMQEEGKSDQTQTSRIEVFDIKNSVLDFVKRITNFEILLQKHFRGYPELISFSNEFFYDNQLQAIKIRGKPINDVISFHEVKDDEKVDLIPNTNTREANAIVNQLKTFAKLENPPECCVITPHSQQQKLILKQVMNLPESRKLMEKLNFKTFTFDTCQGEERDTVIYSMVATKERDRLNYIFPRSLNTDKEVMNNLRLQRLNVGFSRAKERIMIFHSKPLDRYENSISEALQHYKNTLNRSKTFAKTNDVDPNSPMEERVLHWLRQVRVLNEINNQVEIDPQFEIGAYLKQLDPTYNHPNYRVDFLIKIKGQNSVVQIIVEYDGFKEHFTSRDEVNESNFEHYMKSDDIERQKILEGYGYKFLRINRFNIGEDPVMTLDKRLRRLIRNVDVEYKPPKLIEEINQQQISLKSGESKVCTTCSKVKPLRHFFDDTLKTQQGRICITCKQQKSPNSRKSKKCPNCKKVKPLKAFYDDTLKTKYGRVCIKCKNRRLSSIVYFPGRGWVRYY